MKYAYRVMHKAHRRSWSGVDTKVYDTLEQAHEGLMYHLRTIQNNIYDGIMQSYDADQWRIIKMEVVS